MLKVLKDFTIKNKFMTVADLLVILLHHEAPIKKITVTFENTPVAVVEYYEVAPPKEPDTEKHLAGISNTALGDVVCDNCGGTVFYYYPGKSKEMYCNECGQSPKKND